MIILILALIISKTNQIHVVSVENPSCGHGLTSEHGGSERLGCDRCEDCLKFTLSLRQGAVETVPEKLL